MVIGCLRQKSYSISFLAPKGVTALGLLWLANDRDLKLRQDGSQLVCSKIKFKPVTYGGNLIALYWQHF